MRDNKRRIKKRLLAEIMKVYREYEFPVKTFTLGLDVDHNYGVLTRCYHERPFDLFDEVFHQCARLEGRVP